MSEVKVNKISPRSGTGVTLGDNGDTFTVPSGATLDIASGGTIDATGATITGFDAASDEKVKVSSNDTTPGFLNGKLVAGTNITLTEGTDGGNETFTVAAAGGITEADQWRLTASITTNTDPISSNLERVDDASFAKIGTGMSVSSGYWSFPTTGLYMITTDVGCSCNGDDNVRLDVFATTNNSSYDLLAYAFGGGDSSGTVDNTACTTSYVNVTDTSNVKVKFGAGSIGNGSAVQGNTDYNYTSFTFIRLGDSQ